MINKKNNIYKFKKNNKLSKKKNNQRSINVSSDKSKSVKTLSISERLGRMLIVFFIIFFILVCRLGWLQLVQGADLQESMYRQLTASKIISPKRGTIYDSTGKALAISAQVDTVSINPTKIVEENDDGDIDEAKTKELKEKVENDKIDKLENWMETNKIYSGINIDEDTKRYYPYDNLASNLIGFCGTDNQGLWGLESKWNDILTGTPGKITSAQDAMQDLIPYSD